MVCSEPKTLQSQAHVWTMCALMWYMFQEFRVKLLLCVMDIIGYIQLICFFKCETELSTCHIASTSQPLHIHMPNLAFHMPLAYSSIVVVAHSMPEELIYWLLQMNTEHYCGLWVLIITRVGCECHGLRLLIILSKVLSVGTGSWWWFIIVMTSGGDTVLISNGAPVNAG